jgi:hypothetical protein
MGYPAELAKGLQAKSVTSPVSIALPFGTCRSTLHRDPCHASDEGLSHDFSWHKLLGTRLQRRPLFPLTDEPRHHVVPGVHQDECQFYMLSKWTQFVPEVSAKDMALLVLTQSCKCYELALAHL